MDVRKIAGTGALTLCLAALGVATDSQARSVVEFEVDVAPPPPRVEVVPVPREGYIYEPPHYAYDGANYVWMEGRYIREREGHRFVPYALERHGDRWHYRGGHWDDDD